MPKTSEKKGAKRRTQVKDLPKGKKELSKAEQKKVKGGAVSEGGFEIESVRFKAGKD